MNNHPRLPLLSLMRRIIREQAAAEADFRTISTSRKAPGSPVLHPTDPLLTKYRRRLRRLHTLSNTLEHLAS